MPAERSQPILIIGSGAMACLFAARFSAAGLPVRMLDDWQAGIAALRRSGVCLEDETGRRCYPVEASHDPSAFAGAALALVFVKTYQNERAAAALARLLAPRGVAVTLQNGLGNAEFLAARLGAPRVAVGVTTLGAALLAPATVRATGSGEILLAPHPALDALLPLLRAAGFDARAEPELQTVLWGKLVINAAINPVSALLRLTNGDLFARPAALQVILAAAQEAAAVAAALGIHLPYPDPAAQVRLVLQRTAANRSSMLQDVERRAPTEIDAINGAVVRAAAALGLPVPVNTLLLQLVSALSPHEEENHAQTRPYPG